MSQRKLLSDEDLKRRLEGIYEYEQVPIPQRPPDGRCNFEEIILGYSQGEARVEALRCLQCQDPPCVKACPAHLDVPGFLKAIAEGDERRGLQIIMDTYPLPGTCGRICFHPCTEVCLKNVKGVTLNIPRLRRYLADSTSQYDLDYAIPPSTGFKVAVIGSGPGGLTCAYRLHRKGHAITVFEKDDKPGGTLNILPAYRLPHELVQKEIKVLEWLGIGIKTNAFIEGDGCLDRLLEEFDAVFVSVGAIGSSKPKLLGADLPGSRTGLDYLREMERGHALPYQRVAVVGGGNVAMDCLRTALRTSEVVHWVYRRGAEEMPTSDEELIELGEEIILRDLAAVEQAFVHPLRLNALREAKSKLLQMTFEERRRLQQSLQKKTKARVVEALSEQTQKSQHLVVHMLTDPVRVLGSERVEGMELKRMQLSEPDASGRRKPVPVEGSEFSIEVDVVIFAIGQNVESGWLGQSHGLNLDKSGQLVVAEDRATSRARVFAGGDAVRGPASMIEAIADGIRAAESIHAALSSAVPADAQGGQAP